MRRAALSSPVDTVPCSFLVQNQLTGTIPSSLGSLTALNYLCAPCRVFRAVPSLIRALRRGLFLCRSLYNNSLTGTIPSSLGSLNALFSLYVHALAVSRFIPLTGSHSCFAQLSYSLLANSGLCGTVPMSHQPDDGALPACPSG